MPSLIGNTTGSVYGSIAPHQDCMLQSFTLVNKTNGSITANLAIKHNNVDISIIPKNQVINVYEMYLSDTPRQINKGDSLVLLVTGSCDYVFSYVPPYNK